MFCFGLFELFMKRREEDNKCLYFKGKIILFFKFVCIFCVYEYFLKGCFLEISDLVIFFGGYY